MTDASQHLLIAYSWSVNNIGDIGITPGLLNLLRQTAPALPAVVMTGQGPTDPAVAMLRDYLPRHLPGCQVTPSPFAALLGRPERPGSGGRAWSGLVSRWGNERLRSFAFGSAPTHVAAGLADDLLGSFANDLLAELRAVAPEAAAAFDGAGFVHYNSGTTLNFGRAGDRDFWGFTLRYAMPLLLARALGRPYGVGGQSVEAIDWPADLLFQRLFDDARFVYCRDTDSLAYLRQRGLRCGHSGFRPDSTFFFGAFDDAWAVDFMAARDLLPGQFMTVTIRCCHDQPGPLKGRVPLARQELHMARIRELIVGWVERTGRPVVLCPEVRSEVEAARRLVHDQLPPVIREQCHCLDDFWTTEQAYSLYQRAELVCSMEMHSVIMALSLGTPVLLPYFDENGRKVWMLRDLGLTDWLHNLDETPAEAMLSTALGIHADPAAARARVTAELPRLRALGESMVAEILAAMRQG